MKLFLAILVFSGTALGSYRVHQLKVIQYDAFGKPKKTEVVLSTLDHLQYEHYHGGYRWARVELMDTWYCPGDTSRKKYCKKPVLKERDIASEKEKRTAIPYTRLPVIP